ncbi:MAG: site-specific DNA-methyltransferase [Candidatus Nealsonbacteria bacterium]|nr:site-specific DNA-methyltransferase [Candidatus Nealsonbacteria bacterium]
MTKKKRKKPAKRNTATRKSAPKDGSARSERVRLFHETPFGKIYHGDSLRLLNQEMKPESADLLVMSPPFGLVRKKAYGNVDADQYLQWFRPFGEAFRRVLKPRGSLVIDIGGAWIPGQPTRSLYHFELLLMLCRELGFHLAQEFFWWNPSKIPSPAEWVTVRRIRVKDAVNCIWWLSPSPWPKSSNRRVAVPYSDSMKHLLKKGHQANGVRPSGHDISEKFSRDHGSAIPPNLIAVPNTESNSYYLRYCRAMGLSPHPARFPSAIPEYFIRMLTDIGDTVVDPFAGSCVTGEVAERLKRNWTCCDLVEEYLHGALARFDKPDSGAPVQRTVSPMGFSGSGKSFYRVHHPGSLWEVNTSDFLQEDGGQTRPQSVGKNHAELDPTKE